MSRVGKNPIKIPSGVTVNIKNSNVEVKGPKGLLERDIPEGIMVESKDGSIVVTRKTDSKDDRSMHGLMRILISNMVVGTTQGFEKKLLIEGVGYKANLKGKSLVLNLGYSHPITYDAPLGVNFEVKNNEITVKGIDKERVGQAAVKIRSFRKPEPYKGKGIRYVDEVVRRKVGKAAGK